MSEQWPEICLWSWAIPVYKYTKIQEPWFQRNYIIARDQKIDLHGRSFQSLMKINCMLITRPFAYNESLQHLPIPVLLIKILLFFYHCSVHLFQSNQPPTVEFVDRPVLEKLYKTCLASDTQGFLFPVSTVSAWNAWDPNRPFVS